jgi:hypothetical protein
MRATVEEALRHAAESAESEQKDRAARQVRLLENLGRFLDVEVLASEEIWR